MPPSRLARESKREKQEEKHEGRERGERRENEEGTHRKNQNWMYKKQWRTRERTYKCVCFERVCRIKHDIHMMFTQIYNCIVNRTLLYEKNVIV